MEDFISMEWENGNSLKKESISDESSLRMEIPQGNLLPEAEWKVCNISCSILKESVHEDNPWQNYNKKKQPVRRKTQPRDTPSNICLWMILKLYEKQTFGPSGFACATRGVVCNA